jgi:hypothetical protein
MGMTYSSDTIGNRTRELLASSALSQSTALSVQHTAINSFNDTIKLITHHPVFFLNLKLSFIEGQHKF